MDETIGKLTPDQTLTYRLQDLDAHEKLERWGSVLFLAGILLFARELKQTAVYPCWLNLAPAIIGVYGCIFLQVLYRRIHVKKAAIHGKTYEEFHAGISWLGFVISAMPPSLGANLSLALS